MSEFTTVARERIHFIQDRLLNAARWAEGAGASAEATEFLIRPYRALLDELYERELPLAKLVDDSDLLLHVRGPAASAPTPRVSVLTRLLGSTRDQVTRLAKQLGGVATVRVPAALDMGFVGIAQGSLYIGFTTEPDADAQLTRDAVDKIATAGALVAEDEPLERLAAGFDDPAARDLAVAAIRQLSPSGHAGITQVDLFGRRVIRPVTLTTETRRHARRLMAERPTSRPSQRVTFRGTVREMDLDASRFEIRNVDGHPVGIRCAHELDESDAKQLVDRRVTVSGLAEFGRGNDVRLLWVDQIEVLE